ncbi:hypothetical protein GUITHDRAFT_103865 [Guillardia theta CCMP2712]|uniref:Uncharacterized protein n=1 Tax=Guillardia theta (strain CCMP2712) TaxID=905079 RepID=L1JQR7_GUITC|nr:hypothetical protein GUITHDRAFT_103865 [Guillardia theta CCMP2712]EKX50639.1 hypothetical protein GUITHDRAFT_103865 [Guillardia theta CCMP2712]|eukprot:XP_005837619.1 hypothetical protein GUITHDRAFT_103865 [Guillardia theta CCMP2712]
MAALTSLAESPPMAPEAEASSGVKKLSEPSSTSSGVKKLSEPSSASGVKKLSEPSSSSGVKKLSEPSSSSGVKKPSKPHSSSSGVKKPSDQSSSSSRVQRTQRMSFRGYPGNAGFKRLVLFTKTMADALPRRRMARKRESKIFFEKLTETLNRDPLFGGALKYCTARDKGTEVIKITDKIIADGEEDYLMTIENEGRDINELDELYIQIARIRNSLAKQEGDVKTNGAPQPTDGSLSEKLNDCSAASAAAMEDTPMVNQEPSAREEREPEAEQRSCKRAKPSRDVEVEQESESSNADESDAPDAILDFVDQIESSFTMMVRSLEAKARERAEMDRELQKVQLENEKKLSNFRSQYETLQKKIAQQMQHNKEMEHKIEMLKSILSREEQNAKNDLRSLTVLAQSVSSLD